MTWTKQPPIHGTIHGCFLNPTYDIAPMDMLIAVGFGDARVTRDGETVYSELKLPKDATEDMFWTTQDAENEALKDPDHDWRIVLYAPLYGRIFQRQGDGEWVLIGENEGFA